jgi:hypothetical protein
MALGVRGVPGVDLRRLERVVLDADQVVDDVIGGRMGLCHGRFPKSDGNVVTADYPDGDHVCVPLVAGTAAAPAPSRAGTAPPPARCPPAGALTFAGGVGTGVTVSTTGGFILLDESTNCTVATGVIIEAA